MRKLREENQTHFIITFRDAEKLLDKKEQKNVTLSVKQINDSNLGLGFIRLSGFIFEENSLLIDPQTEKLRERFKNTKNLHLSIYNVVCIEEVGPKHGGLHFKNDKSKLHILPNRPSLS